MIVKLALLFVYIAIASGNPAAGKPWHWKSPRAIVTPIGPIKSPRVAGGTEATPHSWPHQVALFIDDMYFCGGSLISSQWVLTSARCMDGARSVELVLGAHNIRENEASQVTMTSTQFTVHENWNSETQQNDIAVIKLPSSVTLNEYIQTVGLPSSDVSVGTLVTPTGWGKPPDSANEIYDVLHQVHAPVTFNSDCSWQYSGVITSGNICIDGTGGKGVCSGDYGGPLNKDGKTYGITSFGAEVGCEIGYPSVFTRTTYYLDWIQQHTGVTP